MTIRLQRILLPIDFSNYLATATKYACELAARFDAELHVVHTLSTEARHIGGLVCSSDEASLMGVKRRGQIVQPMT